MSTEYTATLENEIKILREGLNTIKTLCTSVNDGRLEFIKGIVEGTLKRAE